MDMGQSAMAIDATALRESLADRLLNIHPAMVQHNQPHADGSGRWSVGGVNAALASMGVPSTDFCANFALTSLLDWCLPDLSSTAIPMDRQRDITTWMVAHGWRAPWTLEAVKNACDAAGIPVEDVAFACGLAWVGDWESEVPMQHWDTILTTLKCAGWTEGVRRRADNVDGAGETR